MASRTLTVLAQRTSTRAGPPSKVRWHAENPSVTVHLPKAKRDALGARAEAAGTTMGALLQGDLAESERALAEARERGRDEGVQAARREGAETLEALRREHAQALDAAADTAYDRGLAEAAPNWRARAERAEVMLARVNASAEALWGWRAKLDGLMDEVLEYVGRRETEPWAASEHGRYVALVHDLRQAYDRCLELDLQRLTAGRR